MTDRVKGFTVVLSEDIRIDDVQPIKDAILMIKGVIHVEESIVTSQDFIVKQRIKGEVREKLYEFIQKEL